MEFNELVLYGVTLGLALIVVWALIELLSREQYRWVLWGVIPSIFIAAWSLTWSTNALKGMPTSTLPSGEFLVLHHVADDKYIYLWIVEEGAHQPKNLKLPATRELKEKVEGAHQRSKKTQRPTIGKFHEKSKDLRLWEFDVESTLPKKDSR